MAIYAYLRVSTDAQDVDNQKHGILEYANKHGLTNMTFVEDTVSGQKKWQLRVSACNRNRPCLQSAHFPAHINCN